MLEEKLEKLKNGIFTRGEMLQLRDSASKLAQKGNVIAQAVVDIIHNKELPTHEVAYLFMGFCPGATFRNRKDEYWIREGICKFDFLEDYSQMKKFTTVLKGDFVILKKNKEFGRTMELFGHGRVLEVCRRKSDELTYLRVDWSDQKQILEVPAMGCTKTVNIRPFEKVKARMHPDFWRWLGSNDPTGR